MGIQLFVTTVVVAWGYPLKF